MDLTIGNYISIYIATLIIFVSVDLLWLGYIAKDVYRTKLKKYTAKQINKLAVALLYFLFVLGLLFLAIIPALNNESLIHAMLYGAAYGFFTYLTYGLTNYATLQNWPRSIVLVDVFWGTFLSFVVSTVIYSFFQVV